jgi:glutamine amidotransferase
MDTIPAGSAVYFLHSFHGQPSDAAALLAQTAYGDIAFCSAVQQGNIIGCQFHPEKSGHTGLSILKRFLDSQ